MKMNTLLPLTILFFFFLHLSAQAVTFRVDMKEVKNPTQVGIRGSLSPLSWKKTYPLTDEDGDGIFTGKINFEDSEAAKVEFKFVHGDLIWELEGEGNRVLILNQLPEKVKTYTFDLPEVLSRAEIAKITFVAADLQKDVDILEKAYTSLHPGLYRYNTPEEMTTHFDALRKELNREVTLSEAFLAFSRFIPKIRCGHTLVNPYNQSRLVKNAFFSTSDKIPFNFDWVEKKMVLTHNLSEDPLLKPGTEILSINGMPVPEIIETLLPYVSADGHQMNKRLYALQVKSIDEYEYFDLIFPLLSPPENGQYTIEALDHVSGNPIKTKVSAMSVATRRGLLAERYGIKTERYDDSWQFTILSDDLAHLKLGTFVTYKMEMNWKTFLKDAFKELKEKNIPNLIIDIRGNEGGMDDVSAELAKYLLQEDIRVPEMLSLTRYQKVPEDLDPYLSTWDDQLKNISSQVEPHQDGFFKMKGENKKYMEIKKSNNKWRHEGKTFLITDASNSSATFYLARVMKLGKVATLVGQTTGGTQKGINGGAMFFLRLPNSGIEMDIPLIGNFPYKEAPDLGIVPDVVVEKTLEDVMEGRDPEIETVKSIISGHK
jgi:C-terminal processing protease CtpA/Prc